MPETKIVEASFRDIVEILLHGAVYDETNDTQLEAALRLQPDKTLRAHSLMIGSAAGREALALLEDNRSPRVVLYGYDGAAYQRLRTEPSRELATSLYGQDEAGNVDALRTDPDRILRTRPYEGYVQVDPLEIGNGGAANNLLWDPGAVAAQLYEVDYLVVNVNGAAITVTVGVDVTGTGVVTHPWMDSEIIPYPGSSGWRSGGIIAGDDDVRGVTSLVGAIIHWRIRRVDTGA